MTRESQEDRARAFVRVLDPALRRAASIARTLEGRVRNRPKAGEASAAKAALTAADLAAQEALLEPLLREFPEVHLEAEEESPSRPLFVARREDADARVVIDPIDGTLRFYLEQRGPYAIMVGWAVAGRYRAALVAIPREHLFLRAVRGGGAEIARGDEPYEPTRCRADGRRVLLSDGVPAPVYARLREAGFEVGYAAGGVLSVAPLLPEVVGALRIAGARGSISARGRIGLLIAREGGAVVTTGDGEPFPDSLDAPADSLLVAADAAVARSLREAYRLAPRRG